MAKKKESSKSDTHQTMELKKHVAVIHSGNKVTLLQRKIANALLYNAYDHLQNKDEHQINIAVLCRLIGYDSNDHRTIKNALINLLSTVIEWNLIDGERIDREGVWNASSIISDASIDGAICTYSYSNKMRKLLYRPNIYGRLNMQVQAKFQSSYGLALFENCSRYQDIGQTPWFDLAKFRKLMGVEESKYKIFRDFKHRVLDKAVEEVNKYSPIKIDAQLKKQNRQVVAIQFLIKRAGNRTPDANQQTPSDVLKLKFGLSKKQIGEVLSLYEEQYIQDKIALIESSPSFISGKIKNLAKYFLCALADDYQAAKLPSPAKTHQQQDKLKTDEYRRYYDKQMLAHFDSYKAEEKQQILRDFQHFLGASVYADIYARDGLKNILIRDQLAKYLTQTRSNLVQGIFSYEEWLCDTTQLECIN